MDFNQVISKCFEFIRLNPIVAIVAIIIFALLLYFKTKPTLRMLAILLACLFVFYLVSLLGGVTSKGVKQTEKMIQQDQ